MNKKLTGNLRGQSDIVLMQLVARWHASSQ